jgi:hypothetical protein
MNDGTDRPARVADLLDIEGKAELIGGRVITFSLLTVQEARDVRKVLRSLDDHVTQSGVGGEAVGSGVAYILREPLPSGRLSFCPEVSYIAGPPELGECGFILGAPAFAVEFGQAPREPLEPGHPFYQRLEDYFAAGTEVVWTIDSRDLGVYYHRRGERKVSRFPWDGFAHAEPAVPGWRFPMKTLLPDPRA